MIYGDFDIELNSDYKYRRGSIVKIKGVRYEIVHEIVDAVTPILMKERNLIKEEIEKEENE